MNQYQHQQRQGQRQLYYNPHQSILIIICTIIILLYSISTSTSTVLSSSVDTTSMLWCDIGHSGTLTLQWSESIYCTILCSYHHLPVLNCAVNQYTYIVGNHLDSTNTADPNINNNHTSSKGYISEYSVNPDHRSIRFRYTAASSGSYEEILIYNNTNSNSNNNNNTANTDINTDINTNPALQIYGSPKRITLLSNNRNSISWFSFHNSLFLVIFILISCLILGILIVVIYSHCYNRITATINQKLLLKSSNSTTNNQQYNEQLILDHNSLFYDDLNNDLVSNQQNDSNNSNSNNNNIISQYPNSAAIPANNNYNQYNPHYQFPQQQQQPQRQQSSGSYRNSLYINPGQSSFRRDQNY